VLAAESMGVRSMATVVETRDARIMIDPGASLAPRRYGLPPHEAEYRRLEEKLEIIRGEMRDSDIIVITHYHYDHYLPSPDDSELYRGKLLLVKDPRHNINRSQAVRAWKLFKLNGVADKASQIIVADSRILEFGGTRLVFSYPVPHGEPGTKLGFVIMVLIEDSEGRFAYTSDVQGPIDDDAYSLLAAWKPSMILLGGPPTYFAGYKVSRESVERGLRNMSKVSRIPSLQSLIVDHHFLRDLDYKRYMEEYLVGGAPALTAAEYMGRPIEQLEARRRELWGRA